MLVVVAVVCLLVKAVADFGVWHSDSDPRVDKRPVIGHYTGLFQGLDVMP